MHLFLYEWATGGGLTHQTGPLPKSLLREGAAMVSAIAADLVTIHQCHVSTLRDSRVADLCLPGCDVVELHSPAAHRREIERLASAADGTLVIAPEFDKILQQTAEWTTAAGGHLLSPSSSFIQLAADKQQTAERLARANIPVPLAVQLEPDEPLPSDFVYPAVLKPIDGAGSQGIQLLTSPRDTPLPYAWRRRLEQYHPGLAASVAFLCGPKDFIPLPPCRQLLSDDGRFTYTGGELPLTAGLAERAIGLGRRVLNSMPTAHGYVGIDVLLGHDPTGSDDLVVEVNPRLTTSYVGYRAACQTNLAEAMLAVCEGREVTLEFSEQPIAFDSKGNTSSG
jgi:predicted ATP-grasp superfamily ATP-dependent carboligase